MSYATTTLITDTGLKDAMKRMAEDENRASFYDEAVELLKAKPKPYPIQAFIIILATWNAARFNKVSDKAGTIEELKEGLKNTQKSFDKINSYALQETNFDDPDTYKSIQNIYDTFRAIKGVDFTGASKIMHLYNHDLFVMWDSYISGNREKRLYNKCNITYKVYNRKSAEGYIEFLKDQQDRVKGIKWNESSRTLAKVIDEYNYVHITMPMQKVEFA